MMFNSCTMENGVHPRTGNILTSPEFTLSSNQELTFTMRSVDTFRIYYRYIPVSVYKTSMFGRIDTLLGSYSPKFNTSAGESDTITYTLCLPVGTYQLVFVASDMENVGRSTAAITQVQLTNSPCTYASVAGTSHQ